MVPKSVSIALHRSKGVQRSPFVLMVIATRCRRKFAWHAAHYILASTSMYAHATGHCAHVEHAHECTSLKRTEAVAVSVVSANLESHSKRNRQSVEEDGGKVVCMCVWSLNAHCMSKESALGDAVLCYDEHNMRVRAHKTRLCCFV